jgi:hypothetical protein
MTSQQDGRRHAPRQELTPADLSAPQAGTLPEVYARNDHARHLITGFAAAMPAAPELWDQVDQALADVPALGAVTGRLAAELAATRMDRANLLAAMRAALGAQQDGESDPLYYVRDELQARQVPSQGHGVHQ